MVLNPQMLGSTLRFDQVLQALQIPVVGTTLPQSTRCPVCRNDTLHLFYDNTQNGAWYTCGRCKRSGDMLDLAARAWDIPPTLALAKLSSPDDAGWEATREHVLQAHEQRQRIESLWRLAGSNMAMWLSSQSVRKVCKINRLLFDGDLPRWQAGPGQFVGAASKESIDHSLTPYKKSVFPGYAWTDAVVIPYCDLPGRVCSFLFLGRDGRPADSVFYATNTGKTADAGIAGMSTVTQGDGAAVVVDDPILMLRFQFKHLRNNYTPLPMLSWHDDGKRRSRCWRAAGLAGKKLVFLMRQPTAAALMQVVEADGWIRFGGPADRTPAGHETWLEDYSNPLATYHQFVHAKGTHPWSVAMRSWLKESDPVAVEHLLHDLEQRNADVSYILRQCGRTTHLLENRPSRYRVVQLDDAVVTERNDTWHISRPRNKHRELLNCTVQFNKVVKDVRSGECYYVGEVRYRGRCVGFVVPVREIDDRTFVPWLRELMLVNNLGALVVAAKYVREILQVAMLFKEPELVEDDISKWAKEYGLVGD